MYNLAMAAILCTGFDYRHTFIYHILISQWGPGTPNLTFINIFRRFYYDYHKVGAHYFI